MAADEIEEISQSKSRLMSAVSHDLRTPLTSILGYSELIGNLGTDYLVSPSNGRTGLVMPRYI